MDRAPRPSPRPAPLWKKLALSAVSLLLTALLLEVATRILAPPPAPVQLRDGVYVSQIPMVNGRDTVHTTDGAALPVEKRSGEKRVFVFGESSIEGAPWMYAGSPPTMLYDQLRAGLPAQDLTVVNMGRSASMMRDAYYFLVTIERYRPDFVVFYQGMNDEFHTDPEACLPSTRPRLHGAWRWLVERSRFLWTARARGPALVARWTHPRYAPGEAQPADVCAPAPAFRAWVDVLVGTARRMGAEVIVTTTVQNPLRVYESSAPWGASRPLDVKDHDEVYRRLLACVLTPGCDLAAAYAREQARDPRVDDQAGPRGAAWVASAAAHRAHVVDLHAYLAEHTAGGFTPPIFAEDVHLLLDGYWRLAWLWSEAIRALVEGRHPGPPGAATPPALDRARYLTAVNADLAQSPACVLLHCADVYLRRGMALVGGALLGSAVVYETGASTRAGLEAQLVMGTLRRDLGMDPALPPPLAPLLDGVDLARLAGELRDHPDCGAVGGPALASLAAPAVSLGPPVIGPGQERVVGDMLGMDGSKPGGCALQGAQIELNHVRARYRCPGGEAVVVLWHPSEQVPVLARTAKFVIAAGDPAPPAPLVTALTAAIGAGEAGFTWGQAEHAERPSPPPALAARPRTYGLAVGGAALIAALLALWRRRRR